MTGRSGSAAAGPDEGDGRNGGDDRREQGERRRSARGLFELRARRDGTAADRRRQPRRWFWQRFRP